MDAALGASVARGARDLDLRKRGVRRRDRPRFRNDPFAANLHARVRSHDGARSVGARTVVDEHNHDAGRNDSRVDNDDDRNDDSHVDDSHIDVDDRNHDGARPRSAYTAPPASDGRRPRTGGLREGEAPGKPAGAAETSAEARSHAQAVSPSALTPPLPSTLGGQLSGVPSFFIDSFSIPPFLLPIYQAAGAAYGIPWQVLAAINEVETDYGRDLSVSSAGAEGWMQFLPSTWGQYGVDVNNDGFEDPYNPADAIFAAARYLKAAGGDTDIRAAVLAYNHSEAYVESVILRARLLGGTPPELLGAITGLTEARFPVYAASHYSDGFPRHRRSFAAHGRRHHDRQRGRGSRNRRTRRARRTDRTRAVRSAREISLRDAYGNTYTYAELGSAASLYPGARSDRIRAGSCHAHARLLLRQPL